MTVEFFSGPNLVEYDYSVSCFEQDLTVPTTSCGAVVNAGLSPIDTVSGSLPRGYSRVVENITVRA